MTELLQRFDSGELIALTAIVLPLAGGLLCALVSIVLHYFQRVHLMEVKLAMLNRGMSAEEIRTVIDAGSKRSRREFRRERACSS
jgi:hypothetical protein